MVLTCHPIDPAAYCSASYPNSDLNRYYIKFEFDTLDGAPSRVVDGGLYDLTNDKWIDPSSSTPLVYLHRSGSCGSLIFINNKTGERLAVTIGVHKNRIWGGILTDIPDETLENIVAHSNYGERCRYVEGGLDKAKVSGAQGATISLGVSLVWDGKYQATIALDDPKTKVSPYILTMHLFHPD